jgi:hypothetical protein
MSKKIIVILLVILLTSNVVSAIAINEEHFDEIESFNNNMQICETYNNQDNNIKGSQFFNGPTVRIEKPVGFALYKLNILRGVRFKGTKIIGPITIKVNATAESGIDRVEFYYGQKGERLLAIDEEEPYNVYSLKPIDAPYQNIIRVIAYDNNGSVSDDVISVEWQKYSYILDHPIISFSAFSYILGKLFQLLIQPRINEIIPVEPDEINEMPNADAGGPYEGEKGEPIKFDASKSKDPDGKIISYDWSYGDGITGTSVNPTHIYETPGTYYIKLVVTDNKGGTDTDTTAVYITEGKEDEDLDLLQIIIIIILIIIGIALIQFSRRRYW